MNFEFQSTLHQDSRQMCAAIAYEWMTAGGANKTAAVDDIVSNSTPAAEAAECVEAWNLHAEWLTERDTTKADIELAFEAFFSGRPDKA